MGSDSNRPAVKRPDPPMQVSETTTTRKLSEARHARESFTQNGSTGDPYRRVVHRPWRKVKVTERRAAEDYAQCMRDLVDLHYPDVEYIRVVQDNLSTHTAAALYH